MALKTLCRNGRSFLRSLAIYRRLYHVSAPALSKLPSITEAGGKSVDVFTRLLRDRIICLNGQITDTLSADVVAQLLCLHFEDEDKLIRLYINSPAGVASNGSLSPAINVLQSSPASVYLGKGGGSVTAGLAIYDTMQHISNPIATLCVGQACSMGSLLLTGGKPGMRYASPHSVIMVHQPLATGLQGYVTDLKIQAANMKRTKEEIESLYVKHTGLSPLVIEKALDRDNYMTPPQAKEFGLIDDIL